jgi:toxin FitB
LRYRAPEPPVTTCSHEGGDRFDRVLEIYAERILAFDTAAARIAGAVGDSALAGGRHPGFTDVAIAAIAKSRELVVATLNRRQFEPLGVEIVNPFVPH